VLQHIGEWEAHQSNFDLGDNKTGWAELCIDWYDTWADIWYVYGQSNVPALENVTLTSDSGIYFTLQFSCGFYIGWYASYGKQSPTDIQMDFGPGVSVSAHIRMTD
jgi:hypothetical protein